MAKECPQCHMKPCMGGSGSGSCVGGRPSAVEEVRSLVKRRYGALPDGIPPTKIKINGKDATQALEGVTKADADAWIKRMGDTAKPGTKKRHYESKPDPDHPGKVILYFVED